MSIKSFSTPSLPFRHFFFGCGLVMFFSEIWKQGCLTFFVNNGTYNWWYFPFQLCSIPMYILLFLPHTKKAGVQTALLTFLMTFGLLGGIAVFADTSGLHYPLRRLTFHAYAWHILLILIGILAAVSRFLLLKDTEGRQDFHLFSSHSENLSIFRDFQNAVLLYLLCCGTAIGINHIFGIYGEINMFYINADYPMVQIIFSDLARCLGDIPAMILYVLLTILGAGILFLLWNCIFRFSVRRP